jgi:type I restriction enzyme S subunit
MSFPRYERYKDSGVEWLGEVPEHWRVQSVKTVATCNDDVLEETTAIDYEISYVEISGVDASKGITEISPIAFGNAPSRARRRVKNGDILVSTVRTYLRAIAPVNNPPANMIASTGFAVIRPSDIESHFLGFIFQAEYLIAEIISHSVGVSYPAINSSELMRLKIPIPQQEEQSTIATFLSRETTKIDELIAEQQQLIELLKEKRQAVISHAVTKGLNPVAPMKDSGVEWLGEVPAHWKIKRLGFICQKIGSGKTPLGGSTTYFDSGVLFIRSQNVYDEGLRINDVVYISEQTDSEMRSSRVLPGDILLNITGASLGRTCLVPDNFVPANVNQHVCIIRLAEIKLRNFIAMVMKSYFIKIQIDTSQNGAAREGLNFEQISKLLFGLPPSEEQAQIVAFIDRETAKIDELIAEAQRAITLLQERRTALISAAVTGKIDVRGLVSDERVVE